MSKLNTMELQQSWSSKQFSSVKLFLIKLSLSYLTDGAAHLRKNT